MPLTLEQASAIASELGLGQHDLSVTPVGGGDIAETCILKARDYRVFIKMMPVSQAGLLSAEADGLAALRDTGTVRVPQVLSRNILDNTAWLALEYLELSPRSEAADRNLGHQLAEMHKTTSDHYGWHRKNFIGRTPQPNSQTKDWAEFLLKHRLGFQFDRLAASDPGGNWRDLKEGIAKMWKDQFQSHQPAASLIHGDLWGGNAAAIGRSEPVIFDPAVHFADRECDLAMTNLFGGFSSSFFEAYHETWPLPQGHVARRPFYKLYHLLNHANLFGGPYLQTSVRLADQILSRY